MTRYAEKTTVSVEKSKAEIERTLTRYGATSFASGYIGREHAIMFEVHGRRVRSSCDGPFPPTGPKVRFANRMDGAPAGLKEAEQLRDQLTERIVELRTGEAIEGSRVGSS